jgi:hypothetical protein
LSGRAAFGKYSLRDRDEIRWALFGKQGFQLTSPAAQAPHDRFRNKVGADETDASAPRIARKSTAATNCRDGQTVNAGILTLYF